MDNLLNILEDEFHINYCLEDQSILWSTESGTDLFGMPMVCFCDIPLSKIHNHIKNYGNYAIGLSKEWAVAHQINPVMYLVPNSFMTIGLANSLSTSLLIAEGHISESNQHGKDSCSSITNDLMNIVLSSKPYEGKSLKDGHEIRFYDEREWRYIPPIKEIFPAIPLLLTKSSYDDEKSSQIFTKQLEQFKLSFSPNDIKYIIVHDEDEILETIDKIQSIKKNWPYKDVKLLTSRIISLKQVLEDF